MPHHVLIKKRGKMNKLDKNFHKFSLLYGVIVFMILMAFAHEAKAEEEFIEEVVVVGAKLEMKLQMGNCRF